MNTLHIIRDSNNALCEIIAQIKIDNKCITLLYMFYFQITKQNKTKTTWKKDITTVMHLLEYLSNFKFIQVF